MFICCLEAFIYTVFLKVYFSSSLWKSKQYTVKAAEQYEHSQQSEYLRGLKTLIKGMLLTAFRDVNRKEATVVRTIKFLSVSRPVFLVAFHFKIGFHSSNHDFKQHIHSPQMKGILEIEIRSALLNCYKHDDLQ